MEKEPNIDKIECGICEAELICPHCYDTAKEVLTDKFRIVASNHLMKYFPDATKSYRDTVADHIAEAILKTLNIYK